MKLDFLGPPAAIGLMYGKILQNFVSSSSFLDNFIDVQLEYIV